MYTHSKLVCCSDVYIYSLESQVKRNINVIAIVERVFMVQN